MRLLVLCTHNSARSQMAEGWLRALAAARGLDLEVWSAGTQRTRVKAEAVEVMREVGIDIRGHRSKALAELPELEFDVVVTVCDAANDVCPVYPAKTRRLHVSFPDPSGQSLEGWRRVRDGLGEMSRALVEQLRQSGKSLEAASLACQGLASRAFEGLVTGSERSMVMLEEKGQEGKRQEAAAHKTKVLFICTGNTARSQMAEAFLRHDGGDGFRAYSAGLRPSEINPYTLRVMEEAGIDMSRHHAKGVKTYLGRDRFDYVVTVCAKAEENCPTNFIGTLTKLHWPFEDPAAFEGSDKDKLVKFRAVRDQIRAQIQAWLKGELDLRSGIPLEDVPQS